MSNSSMSVDAVEFTPPIPTPHSSSVTTGSQRSHSDDGQSLAKPSPTTPTTAGTSPETAIAHANQRSRNSTSNSSSAARSSVDKQNGNSGNENGNGAVKKWNKKQQRDNENANANPGLDSSGTSEKTITPPPPSTNSYPKKSATAKSNNNSNNKNNSSKNNNGNKGGGKGKGGGFGGNGAAGGSRREKAQADARDALAYSMDSGDVGGGSRRKKINLKNLQKETSGAGNRSGPNSSNLNHLLNFSYAESRSAQSDYYEHQAKQFWTSKFSKNSFYSKEQFMQANCQFVVLNSTKNNNNSNDTDKPLPTLDLARQLNDPDLPVDRAHIEEIILVGKQDGAAMCCPICLEDISENPRAAKMTKCGHVFCWPCLLHYLSLSDKAWRKCPICFESIYRKDLRSVRVDDSSLHSHASSKSNKSVVDMRLMFKCKTKLNTVCLPIELFPRFVRDLKKQQKKQQRQLQQQQKQNDVAGNSKLFLFDVRSPYPSEALKRLPLQVRTVTEICEQVVEREYRELKKLAEDEKDQPEVYFVHEALRACEARRASLTTLREQEQEEDKAQEEDKKEEKKEEKKNEIEIDESTIDYSEFMFFYQADDGRRVYMNAMSTRILLAEHVNMWSCPPLIRQARVAHHEPPQFMSDDLRKRYKYLAHLPLHTEFRLVEIDLATGRTETGVEVVSKTTLGMFSDEVLERKRTRDRKEAREQRAADRATAQQRAAEEEKPHFYNQSAMYMPVPTHNQNIVDYSAEYPDVGGGGGGGEIGSGSNGSGTGESPTPSSSGVSTNTSASTNTADSTGPSFANAVQTRAWGSGSSTTGAPKLANSTNGQMAWPTLGGGPPVGTGAGGASFTNTTTPQLSSGWLSMAKQQVHEQSQLGRVKKYQQQPVGHDLGLSSSQEDESDPDVMPAPHFKASFFSAIDDKLDGGAIEQELVELTLRASNNNKDASTNQTDNAKQTKYQKKKNKKTKQLLFSTH